MTMTLVPKPDPPLRARVSLRVVVLAALVLLTAAVFQFGPDWLDLGESGRTIWANAWWIATPGLAAAASFLAAARRRGNDRAAWRDIGLGCAVWAGGTVAWMFDAMAFPGPADIAYLACSLFLIRGMFLYCLIGSMGRIQIGSFVLALSAVGLALLLLLMPWIMASEVGPLATAIACLYPATWFGTTAFGVMCLVTDAPAGRRPILRLLVLGSMAQAIADLFYGLTLMGSTYQIGAYFDGAWVVGFLLFAWAACDQLRLGPMARPQRAPATRSPARQMIDAFVPAAALGLILAAVIVSGMAHIDPIYAALIPPSVLFTAFLGLRGHWMMSMQLRLLEEARRSREQLEFVLESTTDNVVVFDGARRPIYMNRHARAFLRRADAAAGPDLWAVFPDPVRRRLEDRRQLPDGRPEPAEFEEFFPPAGAWLEFHAYPGEDRLSVFFRDVTDERRIRKELEFSARHDSLTGLVNRAEFRRRLVHRCDGCRRGETLAVLYIDLDCFKEVNDTLGHAAGDALLTQVAARLRAAVRTSDTVCRMGGDEFAILLGTSVSRGEVESLAQRLLDTLSGAFALRQERVTIGASIGIALGSCLEADPDRLLQLADGALYGAKAAGRGAFRVADPAEPADSPGAALARPAASAVPARRG